MSDSSYFSYPSPEPDRRQGGRTRRVPAVLLGGLGGVAAGALIAWGVAANASTPTTNSTASSGYAAAPGHGMPEHHMPGSSGTVTAVGAHSVTIRTSSGTKTFAVTSSSDIDKNGEAQLSDLRVGDAVTFDTGTAGGKTVIDHLHAGNEALDRPSDHGPRGPMG